MLCDLCQNIQFKLYLDLAEEEKLYLLSFCEGWPSDEPNDYSEDDVLNNDFGLVGSPGESFYFHHRNLESLQKSANNGCNFCCQVYGLLGTKEVNHGIEDGYDRLYLALLTPDTRELETQYLCRGDLDVRFGEESLGNFRLKDLNDFARFIPSNQNIENNSSTGSPINLDLVVSWLRDCTNDHEYCCHQPQLKSILPYRVLDLGSKENPQNIRLSIGEDRVGSYAALSYCWGKPGSQINYLTKKENLELRQEVVDESSFPKTFTDAIFVCRYLGIRYLWIDSLCIVQDCKSDWQMQSKRMGDIYSNATLTISAGVGEDSCAGLFVERDSRQTYPCALNFEYPKEDGVIEKGAFLICHDWYAPEPTHLDTRGWTFQEKYLSPRTLYFSNTEISWTCASKNASEGLPMGVVPSNNKSDFDRYVKMDENGSSSVQVPTRQRFSWWYQSIEIYSYRIFTYESDRLTALAGLAAKFQTPGDEFLYGLWKSDLAYGLAWRIIGPNEDATDASLTSPIPSWSWASRPGKRITYAEHEKEGIAMESYNTITSKPVDGNSLTVTFLEILSADPMPLATSLAASSTPPALKLRGPVQKIIPAKSCVAYNEVDYRHRGPYQSFQYAFSSSKNQTCEVFSALTFYDEPVKKGDNLYCLPLNDELGCLLLKKVDAGAKFRRVGYLQLRKGRCLFDGVSPTILEII